MHLTSRREFVAAASVTCALVVCGDALAADAPPAGAVEIGTTSDYPADAISDRFAKSHKFFVVRTGARIVAVSNVCTHKSCTVRPVDDTLFCKCHKSSFETSGKRTKGPAKRSLPHFGISLNAETNVLSVTPTEHYEESDWGDARAFVEISA